MTSQRTYQIIIAILVIVILVCGWIAFHKGSGLSVSMESATSTASNVTMAANATSSGNASQSTTAYTVATTTEAVSVSNQPAGMSVTVASVSVNQRDWIAIRDASGRTLGAALFSAGVHTNVTVPLLRATVAGERYQVLLYVDDGSKQFDLHKDALLIGTGGAVIGTTFTAN